jgi:uncharacterized protein YndB with AHSA1/START domain
MKKEGAPIIVEEEFSQSASIVWDAITNIDLMPKWYFENIPAFKPEVGFSTQFVVESGGRSFLHLWKVTEVIPQRKIVYNWKYEDHPGDSFVSFEISESGKSTMLKVSHQVQEDFPEDIPEFTRESCLGGWTYFIKDRLKVYLDE